MVGHDHGGEDGESVLGVQARVVAGKQGVKQRRKQKETKEKRRKFEPPDLLL